VLLYTDGVIEARDSDGQFFGIERFVDSVVKEEAAGVPAAEALRRLVHEVERYQDGELNDDATALMVEWLGEDARRTFSSG
jgi:serine phosphatase RsbU (regulator of sigma subunit)